MVKHNVYFFWPDALIKNVLFSAHLNVSISLNEAASLAFTSQTVFINRLHGWFYIFRCTFCCSVDRMKVELNWTSLFSSQGCQIEWNCEHSCLYVCLHQTCFKCVPCNGKLLPLVLSVFGILFCIFFINKRNFSLCRQQQWLKWWTFEWMALICIGCIIFDVVYLLKDLFSFQCQSY